MCGVTGRRFHGQQRREAAQHARASGRSRPLDVSEELENGATISTGKEEPYYRVVASTSIRAGEGENVV